MNSGMNAATERSQEWETPKWLFDQLNDEFKFTVDAAATAANTKLPRFWTEAEDGLAQSWLGERVFVNPPYNEIAAWAGKASFYTAALVVMIAPVFTDQRWFHTCCKLSNAEVRLIRGRVRFEIDGKPAGSPRFPSMVVIWRPIHWLQPMAPKVTRKQKSIVKE